MTERRRPVLPVDTEDEGAAEAALLREMGLPVTGSEASTGQGAPPLAPVSPAEEPLTVPENGDSGAETEPSLLEVPDSQGLALAADPEGSDVLQEDLTLEPITPQDLDEAAELVYVWLTGLDPLWQDRLIALREERHFSAMQVLASLCGWMLDQGYHMSVPSSPYLETGDMPQMGTGPRPCPICGLAFTPVYPGQPACLQEACGVAYNAQRRAQAEAQEGQV